MCATMVLGTAVTAVAAPSNGDYKNAETILKQYNADKGNIIGEYDAKKENVKFTTEYVKKDTANNTVKTISYSYAFTGSEDSYVKILFFFRRSCRTLGSSNSHGTARGKSHSVGFSVKCFHENKYSKLFKNTYFRLYQLNQRE